MESKKEKSKIAKILKGILIALASIIVVLVVAVVVLWHNEIGTMASMKLIRDRNDAH